MPWRQCARASRQPASTAGAKGAAMRTAQAGWKPPAERRDPHDQRDYRDFVKAVREGRIAVAAEA
jgi:hypothetical protein